MKHRHTTQQCGLDCGRDIPDTAYACVECADRLRDLLTALPDLEAALDDLTAKPQTVTAHLPADDAHRLPAEKGPVQLPYRYSTSEARWELRSTLLPWADQIARRRGLFRPFDTLRALGPWLATQVGWLRHQPDGPRAIDEMTAALRHALHVIDRPADRKYAGPCTVTTTDPDGLARDCDGELYAHPGASTIPCPQCGAEYDVADRRAWLLEQAEDRLLPATELARAVDGLGVPITGAMIRGWVHRGRLTARGLPGAPVYRVGDVLELVRSRHVAAATVPA